MADTSVLVLDVTDDCVAGIYYAEERRSSTILAHHCAPRSDRVSFETALAEVVEKCGGRGARCHASFGAEFFLFRTLHLPFSDQKKVQSILPFEIKDSVSTADESYLFDCLLEPSGSEGTDVLVALLKKEVLRTWLSVLRSVELDPEVLTISGLPAAFNLIRLQQEKPADFVLLDVGFRRALLQLVLGGSVRALRSVAFDVQREAGFACAVDAGGVTAADPTMIPAVLKRLSGEIHNTLFALRAAPQDYQETLDFRLAGPVGSLQQYQVLITKSLGQVQIDKESKPYGEIGNLETVTGAWPAGLMDGALALACSSARDRGRINFRKDEFARKGAGAGRSRLLKMISVALAGLMGAAIIYLAVDYRTKASEQHRILQQVAELYRQTVPGVQPGRDPVNELRSKVNEMQGTDALGTGLDPDITAVNLLADISARIPATMQVTIERFIYDRKTVRVRGLTDNFNTVDQMKKALEASPFYSDVSIGSANIAPKEEGVRFELKLQL